MALLCYHAAHEQFPPSHLLKLAVAAEQAGFDGLHSSDHFHPWGWKQGHSGFSFAWVAAAMQATSLPMSMVCAPGQRYHPAIVAQAIATLGEMFPGRFAIELGSGEALNECITGGGWPEKKIREARLLESAHVIRRLLKGEEVSFEGYVTIKNARLWTLPSEPPPLIGAAISETTARWVGNWADGLLTTADKDFEEVERKIAAFRQNGSSHKPVYVKYTFSYARNLQAAIDEAWEEWKGQITAENRADIATPEEFDRLARQTTREEVLAVTPVFSDMDALREQIGKLEGFGVDRIILHNLGERQEEFIEDFARAFGNGGAWMSREQRVTTQWHDSRQSTQ
jgi:coenzyme F420-dependent glucose-6-phosphate dehydrogenase